MRSLIVLAGVLPVLAACSGASDEQHDASAAAARYSPPTVTSRLDYGGQIERRFHRLDKNADDALSSEELPERLRPALGSADTDRNGSMSSEEWGALMLGRFDQQDINKDGSVTTEERQTARAKRAGVAG